MTTDAVEAADKIDTVSVSTDTSAFHTLVNILTGPLGSCQSVARRTTALEAAKSVDTLCIASTCHTTGLRTFIDIFTDMQLWLELEARQTFTVETANRVDTMTIQTHVWYDSTLVHVLFEGFRTRRTQIGIFNCALAWTSEARFVGHDVLQCYPALSNSAATLTLSQVRRQRLFTGYATITLGHSQVAVSWAHIHAGVVRQQLMSRRTDTGVVALRVLARSNAT